MSLNNKKGFTLIELLVATSIIGIVVAVAVPQFTAYKTRAYDTNVKANLKSVFTACQEYWTFNSSYDSCLLTTITNSGFGFIPSDAVEVSIDSEANNTEHDFYATARHASSSNIFSIDYRGIVSLVSGGGEQNNSNDGGNEGNNGNPDDEGGKKGKGCSEEAQNDDPDDLGKNAKGGCGTAKDKKGKK